VVDIRQKLVELVGLVCGQDPCAISDDSTLGDLGVDSLDLIELTMLMEEAYSVRIEADDFEGVATFGEAVAVFRNTIMKASG